MNLTNFVWEFVSASLLDSNIPLPKDLITCTFKSKLLHHEIHEKENQLKKDQEHDLLSFGSALRVCFGTGITCIFTTGVFNLHMNHNKKSMLLSIFLIHKIVLTTI